MDGTMDRNVIRAANFGICAYFLIMYSCLMFVFKLWYATDISYLLGATGFYLAMLLIGFFFFRKYRKALKSDTDHDKDNESVAMSASVNLIGGSVIMVIMLQLLANLLSMSIVQYRPEAFFGILICLLVYAPFIIFAVIKIKKGFELGRNQPFLASIQFLCIRVLLLYLLLTGVYRLMKFVLINFTFSSSDFYWMLMPIASIAAALILYFAPLHIKRAIKDTDSSSYNYLSAQSCAIGGRLLLLTGLFETIDLIPIYRKSFELATVLIFLAISIFLILYGTKKAKL